MPLGDVANDVLVILHAVAHQFQRREPDVDFGLTGRGHFVMLTLDRDAGSLQFEAHFVSDVLQRIHWRNREIAFLWPNFVAEVRNFLAARVPMTFCAVDQVETGV